MFITIEKFLKCKDNLKLLKQDTDLKLFGLV